MRREGAGGEEVVAAAALEAANQLTHVRGVVVLRRAQSAQLRRPLRAKTVSHVARSKKPDKSLAPDV